MYRPSQSFKDRVAMIESNNNPNAKNPKSSAKGKYQFIDSTAKAYGLADPFDEAESEKAFERLTADNYAILSKSLKREPTEGELYLAHQQGAGGALKLLRNADKPAVDVVGANAIKLNGGKDGMTAGQFASLWTSKLDGQPQLNQNAQAIARGMQQPRAQGIQQTADAGNIMTDAAPEMGFKEVTDPAILEQLNSPQYKEVTDPKILEQLNGQNQESNQQVAEPQESIGRTVFDQSLQGGTFGFADEITDRIGSAIAEVGTAIEGTRDVNAASSNALYQEARQTSKDRLGRQMNQNPLTSVASNIAGGLLTGGAAASTKVGGSLANSLRSGNALSRVAKSATAGAASGAAYGAGAAEDGQRLEGAGQGAVVGAALGAAAPVAGAALNKLVTKKSPIPNADELRKQASKLYQEATAKGGVLTPAFTDKFVDAVEQLKPQTQIGQIVGGDTPFTKVVEKIGQIRGKEMSLDAAQELDELLGEAIDGFTDMGKLTKQGKKLLDVQSTLRNMIEDADPSMVQGTKEGFEALKAGRKMWSQSRKLADIERIIQRAEGMEQPATAIKSGFRTLLNNPQRMKGFSKAEQEAIRKASQSGVVQDVFRLFGSRLVPIITGASTGGLGATAAATAASTASRGIGARIQVDKANALADLVASGGAQQPRVPRYPMINNALSKLIP